MSRRINAAIADLRAITASRRLLLTGGAALPLVSLPPSAKDPATAIAERWLAVQADHEALTSRWQNLETYLFREHDWPRLSHRQRAAFRQAAELDAIDDRLDSLNEEQETLIAALPAVTATTVHGLALKLAVAAAYVRPEHCSEGHNLIRSIQRDLRAITGSTV